MRLISQDTHTHYKYNGQTQELQGISFRIGEGRFKGSQIDRRFSLGNLQKALTTQRQRQKNTPAISLNDRKMALLIRKCSPSPTAPKPKLEISPLLEALLKHTETGDDGVPYELTDAYRKKKKKRRGLGL